MKRALAVAVLPAALFLLLLGSIVGILVRADDDEEEVGPSLAGPGAAAPAPTPAPSPTPDGSACSFLSADSVAKALGLPAGRMRATPRLSPPGQPIGCVYLDATTNQSFFLEIRMYGDPIVAREETEALTGTTVLDLGDVARYQELEDGSTTIDALAGTRLVSLRTFRLRVPQDVMAGLAREVLSRR